MTETLLIWAIWTAFAAVLITAIAYTIGTIRIHRRARAANRRLNRDLGK